MGDVTDQKGAEGAPASGSQEQVYVHICTREDMERFPCYECYRDNDFDAEPNPGCTVCGGTGIVRVDVGGEDDEAGA